MSVLELCDSFSFSYQPQARPRKLIKWVSLTARMVQWDSGTEQDFGLLDHEYEPRYRQRVCVFGQDTLSQLLR